MTIASPYRREGEHQEQLPIDLAHRSTGEHALLAEHPVRLLQALLLDPSTSTRRDADLRRVLDAYLRPSVRRSAIRS
jgi:hypothetical protein